MNHNIADDFNLGLRSGGIGYHWRAYRYRLNLWNDFLRELQAWLWRWPSQSHEILLIGPSAGYSLTEAFLKRYDTIWVSEPDALGRFLFKRKFKAFNYQVVPENLLGNDCHGLKKFLKQRPSVDLLFCNLLGQIIGANSHNPIMGRWIKSLLDVLAERNFASYHDIYSFSGNYKFCQQKVVRIPKTDPEDLVSQFLAKDQRAFIDLEDHGLSSLFEATTNLILHWEIVPNRHHLIECVTTPSVLTS